jgi:hypothetical protein
MKTLSKILLALTGVAALSLAYPASVQAVPTTYQYTGNPFTSVNGPYTTSDFVSGMLSLASPLAANMPFTAVTPIHFSFSDGVQTITDLTATSILFLFATGPTGQITRWTVSAIMPNGGINTFNFTDPSAEVGDFAFTETPPGAASIRDTPGTWVLSAPDVGSSVTLLSLSLTALGVAARQFKRAAG